MSDDFMRDASDPIRLSNVRKRYGKTTALAGVSFRVPRGSVYGFLGPNGAGKSTAIRIIVGLQRPDAGEVALFGRPLAVDRTAVLGRIGSLVESPGPYLHLTGRENLEVHRRLLRLPRRSVDAALETVGLTPVANRLARHYSTGMKQRLGIATALLGDPELLVLDEPTNGLDPGGIQEVRSLIRDLPSRCGATIFLSSHLLAEVDQIASHLAILSRGEVRFEGTRAELQARSAPVVQARVDRPARAAELLTNAGFAAVAEEAGVTVAVSGDDAAMRINALLVQAGIGVSRLGVERPTLEDLFLDMTDSEMEKELAR